MNKPHYILMLISNILILACSTGENRVDRCAGGSRTGDVEIYASQDDENITVWIRSNLEKDLPGKISTRIITFTGQETDGPGNSVSLIASDSSRYLDVSITDLAVPEPASTLLQVFFESSDGSQRATELLYFTTPHELSLQPDPGIDIDVQPILTGYKVRLRSDVLVKNVRLSFPGVEGTWSSDCFDLLPGRLGEYYFSVTEYTPGIEDKLMLEYLN